MSGERRALPAHGRTRSYGSLVRAPLVPLAPGRHKRLEHTLQPGETLQGLALKYGVTTEQIKRENRLYTNDSLFLKRSLSIPVMSDLDQDQDLDRDRDLDSEDGVVQCESEKLQTEDSSELSPGDYLRRLDGLIKQSKHAAFRSRQDKEKWISALEVACSSGPGLRRSQSVLPAQSSLVPHTTTKLTQRLQEREDQLFQL